MDFRKFIASSWRFYQREPNSVPLETLKEWESDCEFPGEFFDWAFQHVKSLSSGRELLANPVKAVKELWEQWLRINPNKVERREFSGCPNPYCEQGWFRVYRKDRVTGRIERTTAACGECRRLGAAMTHGMTRDQAQALSYRLPDEDMEQRYQEQELEAQAKMWERYADLREPRFAREGV